MDHAIRTIGVKAFEVGALGKKTGQEIFDEVIKQTGPLKPDHLESLWRRIEEAPKLIWELATEAKQRHDIGNKAGWINRGYMKQMHLGRYAERASCPGHHYSPSDPLDLVTAALRMVVHRCTTLRPSARPLRGVQWAAYKTVRQAARRT